jgi:mono/diheme cytochrome c family protein
MRKIVKVLLTILIVILVALAGIASYVKTALPRMGPSPDIRVAITPERVAKGKYLANYVTVCMDCHSQRDWTLFAAPPKVGTLGEGGEKFDKAMGFPGTLYSTNITPFTLHDWTDGDIFKAITTGQGKSGKALFPLMAYKAYGAMDKDDIFCIIAYLRSLPSINNTPPERELDFPMNFIVNTLPAKAAFTNKPDTADKAAYGGYLVNAAQCADCHSKVRDGQRIAGTEFGGGRAFDFPGGAVITSANLTPDRETGIGAWTRDNFISRFRRYTDTSYHPGHLAPGDYNTPMPWIMYAGMKDEDLGAIYAYLRTVKPIRNSIQKFKQSPR